VDDASGSPESSIGHGQSGSVESAILARRIELAAIELLAC
jgi:hypothetical protein